MGNQASFDSEDQTFSVLKQRDDKWLKQASLGYCEIVRNAGERLNGEAYNVPVDDFQKQLAIYQFRKDHSENIVGVHCVTKTEERLLCAVHQTMRVITERIPYRLGDLGNIGYAEGLYIMASVLKGAQSIEEAYFQSFGKGQRSIKFDESMICFNEKGEAKIWVNDNISSNKPCWKQNLPEQLLSQLKSQSDNVRLLMDIVEKRMSGKKFAEYRLRKDERDYDLGSYEQAINFVQQMRMHQRRDTGCEVTAALLPSTIYNPSNRNQVGSERKLRLFSRSQEKDASPSKVSELSESMSGTMSASGKSLSKPPRPPRSRSKSSKGNVSQEKKNSSRPVQKPIIVQQNTIVYTNVMDPTKPQNRPQIISPMPQFGTNLTRKRSSSVEKTTSEVENGNYPFRQIISPSPVDKQRLLYPSASNQQIRAQTTRNEHIAQFVPIQADKRVKDLPQAKKEKQMRDQRIVIAGNVQHRITFNGQKHNPIDYTQAAKIDHKPTQPEVKSIKEQLKETDRVEQKYEYKITPPSSTNKIKEQAKNIIKSHDKISLSPSKQKIPNKADPIIAPTRPINKQIRQSQPISKPAKQETKILPEKQPTKPISPIPTTSADKQFQSPYHKDPKTFKVESQKTIPPARPKVVFTFGAH